MVPTPSESVSIRQVVGYRARMTFTVRLAVAAGVLFLLGVGAATFLPSDQPGAHCGTWVAPEWPRGEVVRLAAQFRDQGRQFTALSHPREAADAEANAQDTERAYVVCSDALSTRRTWTFALLGLAVVVPALIVFVGRGRAN
jgi:hypothetical protein